MDLPPYPFRALTSAMLLRVHASLLAGLRCSTLDSAALLRQGFKQCVHDCPGNRCRMMGVNFEELISNVSAICLVISSIVCTASFLCRSLLSITSADGSCEGSPALSSSSGIPLCDQRNCSPSSSLQLEHVFDWRRRPHYCQQHKEPEQQHHHLAQLPRTPLLHDQSFSHIALCQTAVNIHSAVLWLFL